MCTVVVRGADILAIRDEVRGRAFDDPGRWWPEHPTLVGGRDLVAGGTWCATDLATGITGLVLNRIEKRTADDGAPSRGVLPLRAASGRGWIEGFDPAGMASWIVVVVGDGPVQRWDFDGSAVTTEVLGDGLHVITSGGAEAGKGDRYRGRLADEDWLSLVGAEVPSDDRTSLLVEHPLEDGGVYATVFGQLLHVRPGRVEASWSRTPWDRTTWTAGTFEA